MRTNQRAEVFPKLVHALNHHDQELVMVSIVDDIKRDSEARLKMKG